MPLSHRQMIGLLLTGQGDQASDSLHLTEHKGYVGQICDHSFHQAGLEDALCMTLALGLSQFQANLPYLKQ